MSLDKKTLRKALRAGDFSDSDKVQLMFDHLDGKELQTALEILSEPARKRIIEKYSRKSSLPFEIPEMSAAKRWIPYVGNVKNNITSMPFRYTHDWLAAAAIRRKPKIIRNRVTDFSGWILSLHYSRSSNASLLEGERAERKIIEFIKEKRPPPEYGEWKKIYQHAGVKDKPPPYKISALEVNGKPFWGAPDFVFKNKAIAEVLIVEIKASVAEIPSDGWPNLRAQLWAYAQIDEWAKAPRVILIGEVWGPHSLSKRYVHRWEYGNPNFGKQNAELFDLFGGVRK